MSERVRCIVSEGTDPDVPRLIAPNGERVPIRYITPPKKLFGSRHYLTRLPVTKDGDTTCTKCGAQHRAYRAGPGIQFVQCGANFIWWWLPAAQWRWP